MNDVRLHEDDGGAAAVPVVPARAERAPAAALRSQPVPGVREGPGGRHLRRALPLPLVSSGVLAPCQVKQELHAEQHRGGLQAEQQGGETLMKLCGEVTLSSSNCKPHGF